MTATATQIETAARHYEAGNMDQADAICCQILKQDINNVNALHLRGVIAYQLENYAASTKLLGKANELVENNPSIMFALAASHENIQQYEPAIALYRKICKISPDNIEARQQLSSVLEKNHQLIEALESYRILNDVTPDDPNVPLALARIYANSGLNNEAKSYSDKVVSLSPNNADILNNLGLVYKIINHTKEAITCFEKALSIETDEQSHRNTRIRLNLASTLQDNGSFDQAKELYRNAIKTGKNTAEELSRAHYNLALMYLGEGDFSKGWKTLIRRPKLFTDMPTVSELTNKKLLILGEEGLGDELTFFRFIPLLKKYGAQIEYIGSPKILPLLNQVDCINQLHTSIPPTKNFDFCISAMDLPFILQTKDVSVIPPLRLIPDYSRSHEIINTIASQPSTLGITWRAGSNDTDDDSTKKAKYLSKQIPLAELCSGLQNYTGTIVILQRNPEQHEIEYLHQRIKGNIIDASSLNEDLALMLQLLSKIHHYVGVSNTNMHLFGSLGKHCDVIVPYPGEWRWMWEGEYSPWYGNFNILRQTKPKKWDNIISTLENTLTKNNFKMQA